MSQGGHSVRQGAPSGVQSNCSEVPKTDRGGSAERFCRLRRASTARRPWSMPDSIEVGVPRMSIAFHAGGL
ncbi:hypothetical protein F751_3516 [Auxenochlorella protothecoides]|uniref:Uncharacterized protein n=1 Tax=Auxenochlorella protothecoides TaxID=3075 RepID=A0A087SSI2_AUXPR|nr:hypothetical protein F751_3516 [Auxenochlorella protothecoides]KFM28686.1 hypothetical protein F751_3516 [Auxenochlorella protothecoides]